MASTPEIYEVQTLNNGRWTIQSRCRTEAQAVAEACEFFDRRQCTGVKVVKEAFDEAAKLYREFTVFRLPSAAAQAAAKAGGPAKTTTTATQSNKADSGSKRKGLLEILLPRS
jgi:hypothetical protein